ncbi:MAG: FKBP-type peptidyl-prolyl cis-trans isomerase [Gammaproteobacteria bacterium]|nr:MAG: FKBP-type peptidyl-prolyl cis-trans isomerase [Gammaproteobacteria bacterium]
MAPAYHAVGSALRAVAGRGARGRWGRGSGHVGCRRPRAGCALPDIRRRPPVAPGPLAPLPGHVHGRGARVAVGGSPACERAAGRLTAKSAARRPAISHTPDPLRFPRRAVHGPHACEGYPMTLPAPRRGRTFLLFSAAVALVAGSMLAAAQQPPAGAAPASQPAAPAKKAPATAGAAKEAPAKTKAGSPSYSVGVSMGEQLRATGIPPELLNAQQLAQGVHDALSGKVSMTDKDRENLRGLVDSVGESNHRAAAKFLAENGKKPDILTTASGLQYKVLSAGTGASPKTTDEVTVNYRGTLINGTEFDSSYKRGQPANFQVNRVIPGWTEALGLMKPGAKWQLFIPPQLAYDLRSAPPIPPGSLLIFEVELLSVKAAPSAAQPAPPAQPATPPAEKPAAK